ncbi:MAG TPA: putative metal-binding motif-containing protein, partial [Myxococcota bacterium]|nr:putative metal-binding motif-containing protein [Myxococcota bacterium]
MLSILLFLLACQTETGVEGEKDPSEGTTDTGTIDPTRYDSDHDGTADAYDCEPLNFKIHPDATEKCDGIDNNCDGDVDEGDWDADDDGYDDLTACYLVGGDLDCNDANPAIHPDAEDSCDGIDNDCDAGTDEADLDADGSASCDDCDDTDPFT